jgi:Mrp family chromosome partitioning ATPase
VAALGKTTQQMRDKLTQLTASKKEYELIRSRLAGAETLEANLISRVDEARVIMLRDESNFDLVEPARPPEEPLSSGRKLVVVAGMVLGAGAGVFVALLLELLDPVVRRRRDLVDLSGMERVWEFQRVPPGEHSVIDTQVPAEPVAMWFRRLVNEVTSGLDDEDWRFLAVSSAEPRAGRSLVATNLAQALALKERSVILVDSDLRHDAGHRPAEIFDLPAGAPGLWDALRGKTELADLLSATETRGLHLLGPGGLPGEAGKRVDDALVALGSGPMRRIVEDLGRTGRNVVFDLPPLSAQETVLEAAATIGNLVLVARSGQTRRDDLKEITAMLRERDIEVRLILLTDVPSDLLSGRPAFAEPRKRWSRRPAEQQSKEPAEPVLGAHV